MLHDRDAEHDMFVAVGVGRKFDDIREDEVGDLSLVSRPSALPYSPPRSASCFTIIMSEMYYGVTFGHYLGCSLVRNRLVSIPSRIVSPQNLSTIESSAFLTDAVLEQGRFRDRERRCYTLTKTIITEVQKLH